MRLRTNMQLRSDSDLVKKIKKGDLKAFNMLIDQHKNHVYQLCIKIMSNKEEAEEVAQDVFVKVFRKINMFSGNSGLGTWIYRITYNECISKLRKNRKYRDQLTLGDSHYKISTIENRYDQMEQKDQVRMIDEAMEVLDSESKAIVMMHYIHEKTTEEIGEITGNSRTNVKTKLFRARKRMLQYFEEKLKIEKKELL